MKVNQQRADEWYLVISEFLESRARDDDASNPGSLVMALCRVIADASEAVNVPDAKKVEAITRLTAQAMGFDDAIVLLGNDVPPINVN